LKQFVDPVQDMIKKAESHLIYLKQKKANNSEFILPKDSSIDNFVFKAQKVLSNLSFEEKRQIVRGVVDKVCARPGEFKLIGYLPFNLNGISDVALSLQDRNNVNAIGYEQNKLSFQITRSIPLPLVMNKDK
jgi:hypothetical protein